MWGRSVIVHDGLKIAVGVGVTALIAWGLHGPLGQGAAFEAIAGEAKVASPQTIAATAAMPPANAVALAVGTDAPPASADKPLPAVRIATGPVPVGQCQQAVDDAVGGRVISFQPGSAWLNAKTRAIVKDVSATLKHCSGYALEVAGHTDNQGDEGINRIVSEERAKRVRDELVARGVSDKLLSARGYGSSRPVRAGQAGDPANRRITFTVSAGGA
jgi:OOP family OmpA-OmpF porin